MHQQPPCSTLFPYTTLFRSIWYNLNKQDVINFSPIIADKKAMTTASMTAQEIAAELAALLKKSVEERSEEHTSELQSRFDLVCRLLLETKKPVEKQEYITSY